MYAVVIVFKTTSSCEHSSMNITANGALNN